MNSGTYLATCLLQGPLNEQSGVFAGGRLPFDTVSHEQRDVTYNFIWSYEDDAGTERAEHTARLRITNDNRDPTVDPIRNAATGVTVDNPVSFVVTGNDLDRNDPLPIWRLSDDSSAVTGATLNATTGRNILFSWTPGSQFVDTTVEFTFTLTDVVGDQPASVSHALTVNADTSNQDPVIAGIPDDSGRTVNEGILLTFTLIDMDPDLGDENGNWTISPDDIGAEIGRNDGIFTWTPDDTHVGTEPFTVTLTDQGGLTDMAIINVIVNDINTPPALSGTLYNVEVDEGQTVPDSLADTITDDVESGSDITYTVVNDRDLPDGIRLNPDGTFAGTVSHNATTNALSPQNFTFTWIYDDDNGGPNANIEQTSSIEVTNVNLAPEINPTPNYNRTVVVGDIRTIPFTAMNIDDGPDQIWSITGGNNRGASIDRDTGEYTFRPRGQDEGLTANRQVELTDGLSTPVTRTISFDIPIRDPIITISDNADPTAVVGDLVTFVVTGVDLDGNPLTWVLSPGDVDASLSSSTGPSTTFSWTPTRDHIGPNEFTFTLNDNRRGSGTATHQIIVSEADAELPDTSGPYTVNVDEGQSIPTSLESVIVDAGSVPDIEYARVPGQPLPDGIMLNTDGTFEGTVSHDATTAGDSPQDFPFTWTYSFDATSETTSKSGTGTIQVTDVPTMTNLPPVITVIANPATVERNDVPHVIATIMDPEGDPITDVQCGFCPDYGTFETNEENTVVTYRTTSDEIRDEISLEVTSGTVPSNTNTDTGPSIIINIIDPVNEVPTITDYSEIVRPNQFIPDLNTVVTNPLENPPDSAINYTITDRGDLPESISINNETGEFIGQFDPSSLEPGQNERVFEFVWTFMDGSGDYPGPIR